MTSPITLRTRRFRERQRNDEVLLTIKVNRVLLIDTLIAAGALDQAAEDNSQTLSAGIENLLDSLQRKIS
jgi:hypothetical protein